MKTDYPITSTAKCRKCQAPIVWMKAKTGSTMPIDAGTCTPEEQVSVVAPIYDHTKHISHHATCPFAAQFRKPKSPK